MRIAMMKLIALVVKKPELSLEQFQRYWLGTHTLFSTQIAGLRGYRINIALDGELHTAPYHGSAELWWDSPEAFRAGNASAQGVLAGDDTHHFAAAVTFMYTEEHIVVPDPSMTAPHGAT